MYGKKSAFSEEENRVLRTELRRLRLEREWTQAEMGARLGIAQQNVGAIERGGGMNRTTANALARLRGMRDSEELLLEAGVLAEMAEPPPARGRGPSGPTSGADWRRRDMAVRMATAAGYDPVAVQAVVARRTGEEDRHRPVKWWFRQFDEMERDLRETGSAIPAPPKSAPSVDVGAAPQRRRRAAR